MCQQLLLPSNTPNTPVHISEIGVIAAFRQQVLRIRKALRSVGLSGINVGSVEDYQGQEYKIILISTVLTIHPKAIHRHTQNSNNNNNNNNNGTNTNNSSNTNNNSSSGSGCNKSYKSDKSDFHSAWGLLNDPRKFNVAISRAMAMCIVIGSSKVLMLDSLWREFIYYCNAHKSVLGLNMNSSGGIGDSGGNSGLGLISGSSTNNTNSTNNTSVNGLNAAVESLTQSHLTNTTNTTNIPNTHNVTTSYSYQDIDSYRYDNITHINSTGDSQWLDNISNAFQLESQYLSQSNTNTNNTNNSNTDTSIYIQNTNTTMKPDLVQSLNDLLNNSYMNDLEWRNML